MPRNKPGMESYPLSLPVELKRTMEELAEKHHRSLNGEITEALEWWTKFESTTASDLDRLHAPNAGMSGDQLAHFLAKTKKHMQTMPSGQAVAESGSVYTTGPASETIDGIPVIGHGRAPASGTGLEKDAKSTKHNA